MSTRAALPEVALGPGSLAIGDLHLDVAREPGVERFVAFLDGLRAGPPGRRLVLLGDVFEYWVGPAQCALDGAPRVLAALAALVASGCAIDLVPGNRDFLLDARFEALSGVRLRPEGLVGLLEPAAGPMQRVLFVHGDELCTLDRPYQRLRRVLRSGPVRFLGPRVPAALAGRIAGRLRRASRRAVERKPSPSMAQQPAACLALAREHAAQTLVCGHAHVQRDERLAGVRWLVVDAFGGPRDAVQVGAQGELIVGCTAAPVGPN